MRNEVLNMLKIIFDTNKNLVEEMRKLVVLGTSEKIDEFFKNENEGVVILKVIHFCYINEIYRFCNPDFLFESLDSPKSGWICRDDSRINEIMEIKTEIKDLILEVFGLKINSFYKNDTGEIYFNIHPGQGIFTENFSH